MIILATGTTSSTIQICSVLSITNEVVVRPNIVDWSAVASECSMLGSHCIQGREDSEHAPPGILNPSMCCWSQDTEDNSSVA
jgi:hypothetical protein